MAPDSKKILRSDTADFFTSGASLFLVLLHSSSFLHPLLYSLYEPQLEIICVSSHKCGRVVQRGILQDVHTHKLSCITEHLSRLLSRSMSSCHVFRSLPADSKPPRWPSHCRNDRTCQVNTLLIYTSSLEEEMWKAHYSLRRMWVELRRYIKFSGIYNWRRQWQHRFPVKFLIYIRGEKATFLLKIKLDCVLWLWY